MPAKRSDLQLRLAAAEAELAQLRACETPSIAGPCDAAARIRALCNGDQESFVVLLLNTRNRVLHATVVAVGTVSDVAVHPRDVFREAIRCSAHSIIVGHNHPSGDSSPSEQDIVLTRRLVEAGRLLGIPVMDHVIVTARGSQSLASLGIM